MDEQNNIILDFQYFHDSEDIKSCTVEEVEYPDDFANSFDNVIDVQLTINEKSTTSGYLLICSLPYPVTLFQESSQFFQGLITENEIEKKISQLNDPFLNCNGNNMYQSVTTIVHRGYIFKKENGGSTTLQRFFEKEIQPFDQHHFVLNRNFRHYESCPTAITDYGCIQAKEQFSPFQFPLKTEKRHKFSTDAKK